MVLSPTLVIIIFAVPEYTTDSMYNSSFIFFSISLDSPVNIDSSTFIFPLTNIPSAGILSPSFNITKSFTTISSIGILVIWLFLFTFTFILDVSSVNLLNAFTEPYSLIDDINDATIIAITIPIVSYQSKSLIKNMIFIPNAINNILIIGSENVSNNSFINVSCFFFVNVFVPYFFLFIITSSLVSPVFILSSLIKSIYFT